MSRKATRKPADEDDTPELGAGITSFEPVQLPNGGWAYYDHAGRLTRGFASEAEAQAGIDSHVNLENDPTIDA